MKASKIVAFATILPIMMGLAHLAPAAAAPATAIQFKWLAADESARVQKVDCRQYAHVHRRCTLWRGGVCRRWVTYTHRCG